jgi:hypothetical protein
MQFMAAFNDPGRTKTLAAPGRRHQNCHLQRLPLSPSELPAIEIRMVEVPDRWSYTAVE